MNKMMRYIRLTLSLSIFILSSSHVISYQKQRKEREEVASSAVEIVPEENVELPIKIDFEKLKSQNEDVIAWIYSEGTEINYPIVQGEDNDYYLRRLLNGKWNIAGTLFIDYRNSSRFNDRNTFVHGHNMLDGSMFSSLLDYQKQEYYDEHPTIYLLTPDKNYAIEIFAGYKTNVNSSVYILDFSDDAINNLIKESVEISDFSTKINLQEEDKIITLSTCYSTSGPSRYVVLGKLVPI